MSEATDALILAARILDRPWADPDDDLAILARQLLRTRETLNRLLAERDPMQLGLDGLKALG